MKKKSIYALLLGCMALVSCDEVEKMTGKPQENPAIPSYDLSSLQVSSPVGEGIDLPALNAASTKDVPVVEITDPGNLPDGYRISAVYEVSETEDFSQSFPIDVVFPADSTMGYVTTAQLEDAYEALEGLKSDAVTFHARTAIYAVNDKNSVVRLGGDDVYYAPATFLLTPDPAFVLYTPGDSNGWDGASSMQLPSTDGKNYSGLAVLSGSFKFTTATNWDGINYGAGDAEGTLSTDGGAGNITVGTPGLYWVEVSTNELTYTLTEISTFGVIGSFNGWSGDVVMSHDDSWKVWTAEVTFAGDGEWKIRANNDWAISFGTSVEDMTFNGPNIPDPGVGVYRLKFDISEVPYKVTCNQD